MLSSKTGLTSAKDNTSNSIKDLGTGSGKLKKEVKSVVVV
jgi:hypothetical protein